MIDITSSKFKVRFKLFNILGGQATPSDFKLFVAPLSRSFDEGIGRDVALFSDLDAANFITSSYSDGSAIKWHLSGANSAGLLGSTDIDIITSGNLGSGVVNFGKTQTFSNGNEDLNVDVTPIVSGTLVGLIANNGFRVSFTGSEETDNKTRFVKRFASRQSSNPYLVPALHVMYDDSIADHHNDFIFNVSGSLFLNNFDRGAPANIVSGSANSTISGDNCIVLKLEKGDWVKYITGSSHTAGTGGSTVKGVYSASFALDLFSTTKVNKSQKLVDILNKSGSVTFDEYWQSIDGKVGYHTGSLVVHRSQRSSFDINPSKLMFNFTNLNEKYKTTDIIQLKVFVRDINAEEKVYKTPYTIPSVTLSNVYYRVRNANDGTVIIPFETTNNSTKLSSDSSGMFFEFRMISLPAGHTYTFDLKVTDYDSNKVYLNASSNFRVE